MNKKLILATVLVALIIHQVSRVRIDRRTPYGTGRARAGDRRVP